MLGRREIELEDLRLIRRACPREGAGAVYERRMSLPARPLKLYTIYLSIDVPAASGRSAYYLCN